MIYCFNSMEIYILDMNEMNKSHSVDLFSREKKNTIHEQIVYNLFNLQSINAMHKINKIIFSFYEAKIIQTITYKNVTINNNMCAHNTQQNFVLLSNFIWLHICHRLLYALIVSFYRCFLSVLHVI